jgi:hypothetical protein
MFAARGVVRSGLVLAIVGRCLAGCATAEEPSVPQGGRLPDSSLLADATEEGGTAETSPPADARDDGSVDTRPNDAGPDVADTADAIGTDAIGTDAIGTDAPADALVADAPVADAQADAPPATTTIKHAAGTWYLDGVTSDGHALVFEFANSDLYAIPLAGGAPVLVANRVARMITRGELVLAWSSVGTTSGTGMLVTWSAKAGAKTIATASLAPLARTVPWGLLRRPPAAISADGSLVAYVDSVSGNKGDVVVARPDGTGKRVIFAQYVVQEPALCRPALAFGDGRLLATHCGSSTTTRELSRIDPATGTVASLAAGNITEVLLDDAGTTMGFFDGTIVKTASVASGAPVAIEGNCRFFDLSGDGRTVVYVRDDGVTRRSSTTSSAPTTIATGLNAIRATNSDASALTVSSNWSSTDELGDLFLLHANTLTRLGDFAAGHIGSRFTADGSRVLFFDNISRSSRSGTLSMRALAAGPTVRIATDSTKVLALDGAKIAYSEGWTSGTASAAPIGRTDLRVRDLAVGSAAALIARRADADFFVARVGSAQRIVYSLTGNAEPGIYSAPVP